MKGLNLCNEIPHIDPCILTDIISTAEELGRKIGVYVRIDMFLGSHGCIYVQEYSFNHANGLRHCMSKVEGGCVDSCFMGRMWNAAGGNSTFGGPLTEEPVHIQYWSGYTSLEGQFDGEGWPYDEYYRFKSSCGGN